LLPWAQKGQAGFAAHNQVVIKPYFFQKEKAAKS
jgi:hypothetical protein